MGLNLLLCKRNCGTLWGEGRGGGGGGKGSGNATHCPSRPFTTFTSILPYMPSTHGAMQRR